MIIKIVIVVLAIITIAVIGMILKNRAIKAAQAAEDKANELIDDGKQDVKNILKDASTTLNREGDKP